MHETKRLVIIYCNVLVSNIHLQTMHGGRALMYYKNTCIYLLLQTTAQLVMTMQLLRVDTVIASLMKKLPGTKLTTTAEQTMHIWWK